MGRCNSEASSCFEFNWPNMNFDFRKNIKKNDKVQLDEYNATIREIDLLVRNVRAYHHRRNAKERKAEHKQNRLRLESMFPFIIYKKPHPRKSK
ncbi:hypothetical protein Ct9H90mP29_14170 [bacterium]|nr:MAG: hypothetical protein Ct9H90mP29_14170 [bacterium]